VGARRKKKKKTGGGEKRDEIAPEEKAHCLLGKRDKKATPKSTNNT